LSCFVEADVMRDDAQDTAQSQLSAPQNRHITILRQNPQSHCGSLAAVRNSPPASTDRAVD